MSSVTFREARRSYSNLQEAADLQEAAEDKAMADPVAAAAKKAAAADAAAAAVPIVPPRQGLIGAALVVGATVLAQFFATPFARSRMFNVLLATLGVFVLDLVWTHPHCGRARWYVLHAVANIAIGLISLPDLVTSLRAPCRCFTGEYALLPVYLIAAIHLYHMLAFKCNASDYFHHLVFGGLICPMGMFFVTGPVQNLVAFFICGVPGGLDYAMLALVKMRRMNRFAEKKWNSRVNVWMRSPGLLLAAFCLLMARFDENAPADVVRRIPAAVCIGGAALCVLNGQVRHSSSPFLLPSSSSSPRLTAPPSCARLASPPQYYMQIVVGNTFITTRQDPVKAKTHAYNS